MAVLFDVELDAVTEENPQYKNQVSEHTVEDGEEIADHVRRTPRTLQLVAVIAGPDWETRYDRLKEISESREKGSYVGVTVWEDMVIESLTASHTAKLSNGVQLNIGLRQVKVARVETRSFLAPDPVGASGSGRAAAPETAPKDRGLQQPETVEVEEETADSWLVSLGRSIGFLPPKEDA